MSKQYLVIARHGESEANVMLSKTTDKLYYSNSGSDEAVPLTALGISQGEILGDSLVSQFPPEQKIERIYRNDFLRVVQFTDKLLERIGYPVELSSDERLNKRNYGIFWNLTYKGVRRLHPQEWRRYKRKGGLKYRPPQGENYPDVFERVDEFIAEQITPSHGNILVVTSMIVVLSFRRNIEGMSDSEVVEQYESLAVPNAQHYVYCRNSPEDRWTPCHPGHDESQEDSASS